VPSPVFHQGHFYAVNDGGLATCWDARTGDIRWQERLPGHYRSSLVLGDGRVYATNDEGTTTVFRAAPEKYEAVSTNALAEFVYTTPAVAGGRLFIRTKGRLYAIGTCGTRRAEAAAAQPAVASPSR
jgi:outer membrane protein assembly factor BamB